MSTPQLYERHPLGLPPGSVRAILSLAITLMFWVYLVYPPPEVKVPSYLYFLTVLVFIFFAAHRASIGPSATHQASPLYLPRGTLRLIILVGTIALVIWQLIVNSPLVLFRLTPDKDQLDSWPYLAFTMVGGFTVGWLFSHGPWKRSPWYQDMQAWLSMVAMIAMLAIALYDLIIKPQHAHSPEMLVWDCVIVGILSVYFGSRS
jgi:hypothetical protein